MVDTSARQYQVRLDRRTRANANTQCFIPGQIINNRAARSFRYTVLPVGSRSRLRSYNGFIKGGGGGGGGALAL